MRIFEGKRGGTLTRVHQGQPDRDWPEGVAARSAVERDFGSLLDTLMSIRNRARDEWNAQKIEAEALRANKALGLVVLAIYCRALAYLDCIRVLAEGGYGEQCLGLARSIYESEADAYLLFASPKSDLPDQPDLLDDYADFEIYERCVTDARFEAGGMLDGPEVDELRERRRQELRDCAQKRKLDLPPDFDDLTLLKAAQAFSTVRFKKPFRVSWRYDMKWKPCILKKIVRAYESLADPEVEPDSEQLAERIEERTFDHDLFYPLMCRELHGSPAAVANRVEDFPRFRVGGDPDMVLPGAVAIAVSCFNRLRTLVRHLVGVANDEEAWENDLRTILDA